MSNLRALTMIAASAALALGLTGCDRSGEQRAGRADHDHGPEAGMTGSAPTNRVEIPIAVRQNLGMTFAAVEYRNVERTLRVPGRFELHPTARREYRTPLAGRVELLVDQYQRVEAGTPLYRVDSAGWRDLMERIDAARAWVDSMGPLREAHRRHERSLAEKVSLWQDRLKQLDELRSAGGGSASQFTEARAALNATQAELADVMEKDAELQARQKQVEAELRGLTSRFEMLVRMSHGGAGTSGAGVGPEAGAGYTVAALAAGVVEAFGVTPGGLAEENGLILSLVQPEQVRFRARALQSDLGRLTEGLPVRIAPPQGGSLSLQDAMRGVLRISPTADPTERTVDLMVTPESRSTWALAGVAAYLEVVLAGGREELAIPLSAVVRDGAAPIIFRRDPANPDRAIRMEADLGVSDGRWVVVRSGVKEGDQIVLDGNYQLLLATSGSAARGGHFHPDGTFHEGDH